MGRPATVPNAPIKRVFHKTGEIDHPEIGSFVNIAGASIFADGCETVVQLQTCDWRFQCPNEGAAKARAAQLTLVAMKGAR